MTAAAAVMGALEPLEEPLALAVLARLGVEAASGPTACS